MKSWLPTRLVVSGSLAIALRIGLGYTPVAVSGKAEAFPFLKALGARSVLRRDEAEAHTEKPILKARWAGAVETVGGIFSQKPSKRFVMVAQVGVAGWRHPQRVVERISLHTAQRGALRV